MKIKILFLSANPIGTPPLMLDEEIRGINHKIREAEHRDLVEVTQVPAARPDDLIQAMLQNRPHIVHFSGHGSPSDEIILLDDNRNPKPVGREALTSLFRSLQDNVQLVVLNACFTVPQAEAITKHIACAVGMNKAIGDEAARTFAATFYSVIAFGRNVQMAFDLGITRLKMEGIAEENTPVLFTKEGVDAATVTPLLPL